MPQSKKYKADTVRNAFRQYFSGEESDGEQRAFCPLCEDPDTSKTPSASFNADKGVWHCMKTEHGGAIYDLVQTMKEESGFDIRSASMIGRHQDPSFSAKVERNLQRSSKRREADLPSPEKVKSWHKDLIHNKKVLQAFIDKRGILVETIKHFDIGWDGYRYTIPIYDAEGSLVNVRRYKMDAKKSADKMVNIPGHGTAQIYGHDDLEEYTDIVLAEGEPDRHLLWQTLSDEDIGIVTHTAGANYFNPQWAPLFKDKRVWIAYDKDGTGERGAIKVRKALTPFASDIFAIEIPLETTGADVTDYIHGEGHSVGDFLILMKLAEERARGKVSGSIAEVGRRVSLLESMSQNNQNEIIELVVSISGKQSEPYTAPRTIEATCDVSKGATCTYCPLAAQNGSMEIRLREDDEQLFRFVDSTETRRRNLLREITGARCNDRIEYDVPENYHIEELLVQPSVDERRDDETYRPIHRTLFSVGTYRSAVNEKHLLVGRNVLDAKTGRLRFIAWRNNAVELDIDQFELTPEIFARLKKFQPDADQFPLDKCLEIAQDMAQNVSHIYQRDLLHVCYDLVWHSIQSFKIGDSTEERGWLECLVVGDTRTGKSEVAKRLIKHYNSGQLLSCEGMSFAGIVGGVQQIDGRWHLTWGAVPMNDRRLVVLDEVSGMRENIIEQMSSIRSSGVAQITKISSEQTSARTRLIWISNPADGSMIADSPDVGLGAMRSVVPNSEDIARFDFVTATAQGEVPATVMNSGYSPSYNPEYPSADCELLIKWAWSLTKNDILISDKADKECRKIAEEIGSRYIPDPPLIQSENVRMKLYRIAAAIAARTFSANKNGKLVVSVEHVRDAARFLDMVYDQESMGYARKSARKIRATKMARERKERCKVFLQEHRDDMLQTLRMVGGSTFRNRDFEEFGAMSRDESHVAVSQLLRMKMVHRKTRGEIGMDPVLLEILREIEDEEEE